MAAEIVHDHDIASDTISPAKSRQKNLLDIGAKAHAIDRPLDERWRDGKLDRRSSADFHQGQQQRLRAAQTGRTYESNRSRILRQKRFAKVASTHESEIR
ncbi:MAG: hypothetical protein KGL35_32790 [Bradyrhizobium sp.]|nr:hypothetical protein [Bradyrhizobium sp.]